MTLGYNKTRQERTVKSSYIIKIPVKIHYILECIVSTGFFLIFWGFFLVLSTVFFLYICIFVV